MDRRGGRNRAWDYLAKRMALADFTAEHADSADDDKDRLGRAWEELYAAEGSDWFGGYGDDQIQAMTRPSTALQDTSSERVFIHRPPGSTTYMPIIPNRRQFRRSDNRTDARTRGWVHRLGQWEKSSFYPKDDAAVFNWGEGENISRPCV